MRQFFLATVFFCCFLLVATDAHAALDKKISDAVKVEQYLQQLHTLKARFIQTAPNGDKTSGVFYLQRPGKMRFEYDEPVDDFIVADGLFIYFYDAEMEQQSSVAIGDTLADFILRKNISLAGDVTVTEIKNKKDDTLHVTLTQTVDPEAGAMTLVFNKKPFRLNKWQIYDAQGQITEISLWEMETGLVFKDKKLFRYRDPKIDRPVYND